MDEQRNQSTIRATSAATVLVLYAVLWFCTNFHYDLNDDAILLRSLAGCVGGVYETFNAFTHTVLAYALHGLSLLWPGVAWLSVAQVALLAGAAYAMHSAVQQIACRAGWPGWIGWLVATLNLLCFGMVFLTSITFTTTAALLGAAGVWRLLAVDLRLPRARAVRGLLASFAWVAAAYLLREVSALPNLCFWVGALGCRGLLEPATPPERRARWRTLALALGGALLILGVLVAIRAADIRLSGEGAYLQWINASVDGIDYGGIRNAPASALAAVGWTEKERALILNWYFMEDNITAEAFASFAAYANAPSVATAVDAVTRLMAKSRNIVYFTVLLGVSCGGAFLAAALDRPRRLWAFLAPVGVAGVALGALGLLAVRGRLPMRAAASVLVPACALALWLLWHSLLRLRGRGLARRVALTALALLLGLVAVKGVRSAWGDIYNPVFTRAPESTNRFTQLETYAMAHPDRLYVAENALGMDWRLFPDWQSGKATNVLYNWGGWNNYSAGYRAAFAHCGLDAAQFTVKDFCDGPVQLVGAGSEPSALLMEYLQEQLGRQVQVEVELAGDGFTVFALHAQMPEAQPSFR
ncbi:MAG: hypothetical protein VB104_04485 [Candidatus Limiplasma sp.]|nr:hypothetical protein [Candidatus Limiplasma sp.]